MCNLRWGLWERDSFRNIPGPRKSHQILLPNEETHRLILDGSALPFLFLCFIVKVDVLQARGTRGIGDTELVGLSLQSWRCLWGRHDKISMGDKLVSCIVLPVVGGLHWQLGGTQLWLCFVLALLYWASTLVTGPIC